ncbi:hypothetical protein G3O08_11910 [Cryomorpha ignava]|uniref:Uncharacterized protein n=1 Tax=Cryomorpha ignava TaxID=101383 RepID=A0A7K3WRA4_9FLAO|nr:hypothetical protein [Cryomorpha ignava]NEN24207.1 hypothetical protein [Cryomorpha ignava]
MTDQEPWGGQRAMFWKSEKQGTFDIERIIQFASKNGWTFVDTTKYMTVDLKTWTYFDKEIFPLSHEGFNPNVTPLITNFRDG